METIEVLQIWRGWIDGWSGLAWERYEWNVEIIVGDGRFNERVGPKIDIVTDGCDERRNGLAFHGVWQNERWVKWNY
jgi:hypothetical protein